MKLKNYLLTIILYIINIITFYKQKAKNYGILHVTVLLLAIATNTTSYTQTFKNFTIRYNTELKGDMLSIGNNILGKDNNSLNDNTLLNENVSMQYIDIDSDTSTYNSSSADLSVPSSVSCFRIAYAGLYWGALIKTGDSRTDIEKIKFKLPGNSTYTDITGEIIYDANVAPIVPDANKPYACYANVTSLLSGLTSPQGTYTAANIKSSIGSNGSTGLAAGWTLFVIYEDPSTTSKYMVAYDGFAALYDGRTLDIPISGFQTPSSGTINLKYAFATLNGDKNVSKSKVEISNGTSNGSSLTTTQRPSNNFFNAAITNLNSYANSRNPNGTNSLGYDTGIEEIQNVNRSTIGNNATSAQITLQVARGQANPIFSFFNAILINVIAPDIELTKIVKDISGNDIGNTDVTLGTNLYYEIGFQNIGNDNVDKFTLKDVLPTNVIFNYPADITYLPPGVTHSYNSTTRTLQFTIPNSLVEVADVSQTIRLHVQVVSDYTQLSVGCSNEIKNQALATYQGVINTKQIVDEGSYPSLNCNYGTPQSTNFLVNIDGHTFTKSEVLCGANVILSAATGYTSYSWSTSPTGTPVISTNQTYTATSTGTYYVTSTSSCRTIKEVITVIPFGNTITNPVIPYADEVVICQNNGKQLPNIFLCGANATRLIQTNISDASTITWEKLNESSCAAQTIANCANENTACQWNTVGTGANFLVNTAGQFRVTLNYPGGCFSRFYFNVYQNLLNPTYTNKDIICTTNGKITIGGVPSGYEYSLDGVTYQSSNVFTITTAGSYTVYIKQVGVTTNPCIFSVPNILIRKRNFTGATIVTQPSCNGDKGSIKIAANDADPQYYYSIYQGATLVNSVGPIAASDYEFSGLNPATYTVRVWTNDGCDYSTNIQIIEPAILTATSALTKPLTCVDGEITVYPVGGTPPYAYYVNGSTSSQSIPQIVVTNPLPTGGIYNIQVVDSKNCSTTTSITVSAIPPPVYSMSQTDIKCYNDNTGVINFNVTNANGYTLAYSIDNGVTYYSNPTFSNLVAGTYNTIVRYTLGTTVCYGTMQAITITQPSTALTASAGISELAGCGPSGEGKVRITNPQGGTLPYEYSFDNQATWTTTNEAYKASGTYTVYIRDANGCTYPMSVTIDAQPLAPTIDVASPIFNCDGSANSTVTITNPGGANFEYGYLLDGITNTNVPSNVFLNVPSGSHIVSVTYKLLTVPTYSNLLKEDFGSGSEVSSPGINAAFCFEKQNFLTCDKNGTLNNGEYTVTNTIKNGIYSGWHNPVDHTAGSATGRYLAVDAGTAIPNNAVLYRKTIKDIIPNQPIQVRFFATNLLKTGNTQPDASLTVELQNSAGTALSSQSTGAIPKTNGWVEYNRSINPGNNTTLDFVLRLELAQVNGIDFAVDDIEVYQLPKSCITQKDFPIIISTGQAFDASITSSQNITCANANNGSITIAAQNFDLTKGFQYSINNGVNWFTQMTSPYTITGLASGIYNVKIRYDATSTGSCVKSFTQTLTAPAPLVTTAAVTSVATCTAGATITASSTGGTAAYRYELWNATGTTNIQPSQNTGIFTNVAPGTYIVRGYDANNCTNDTAVFTVVTPPTVTATLDSSSDLCFDSVNQASLVVNASGGTSPYVYSLDGAPAQNSNTFTNISVGNHSIIVTDSFGCTAPAIAVTIAPQLTAAISNIKELDCSSSPNAIITGTITGGNAPFAVTVLSGTGPGTIAYPTANTFTYTTAVASNYQFQITDSKGCITTTTATINPLVPVTATLNSVNPSCNGVSDGSVQITPSGGISPYTYSFNGSSFTSTSLYTGLSAGIAYAYEVRDSKNCPFTGTVTLTQPTALVASATATTFSCSATNTKQSATITINPPTTGTAPYQYSFNGGGYTNINTLTVNDNGTNQTIPYSVRDANGCTAGNSITLSKLNPPTAGTITNSAVTCNTTTSTVTVTPTAGTGVGTLTYEITFPIASVTSNTTGIFNNLAPDTYIFKVTDANGCYYTESHVVNPVMPITVLGNKTSDVLCKGDSSGSIQYTVSGFSGTYSYVFNGQTAVTGQTTNSIVKNGLATGTYLITVTDETTGCTANTSITITEPAAVLALTAAATNVNCNNDNSQITVNASGGTTNYTYAAVISGASAPTTYSNIITVDTNSATNLIWDVYVKDAKGCIATTSITLTSDALPTINTPAIQCYVGSPINISITGTSVGVPTYSIGSGYQSSPNFTINAAGTYTLSLKDASGCVATTTYTVYPQLTVLPSITKELDCTASPAATITVTAAGGKNPYSYAVSTDGGSTYATMGTNVYSTFVAGTFQFRVTDANNCITTATTTINPLTPITATTTNIDPSCNGASDGSVQIIPSGGVAPYTYSFDGSPFTVTSLYSNLKAGIAYPYEVRDSKNCSFTATVTLTEPVTLAATASVTPFTCSTSNTKQAATITVTATSGTGTAPYQYSFNGSSYSAANTLTLNDNGLDQPYTYSVRDSKGCMVSGSGTLLKLNPPTDLSFTAAPITCTATTTTVTATATNGVGTLTYEITFPTSAITSNTTGIFNNLAPDTYIFKVTDANGCYYTESHVVNPVMPITVLGNKTSDVLCKGDSSGSIQYTVSGFTGTYSYVFNGQTAVTGQISNSIVKNGLATGTYLITVTDETTACTANTSITITEPAAVLALTAAATNVNCNNDNSQITVNASGGTTNYTYAAVISGASAPTTYSNSNIITVDTNSATNLIWDVYVKDAKGCIATTSITLTSDALPTINTPAIQCYVGSPINISITGTSVGVPTYSIGSGYQSSPNFTINAAGTYTLSLKDASGCVATTTYTVYPQLTVLPSITKELDCTASPAATITVTAAGGKSPYSYAVSTDGGSTYATMGTNVYSTLVAGTFQFRVTDANNCITTATTTINPLTPITATTTNIDPSCNGASDGSVQIIPSGGVAPYTYSFDGSPFTATSLYSNLKAGIAYPYEVRDSKNCSFTATVTLTEPVTLAATASVTPFTCSTSNTKQAATITVTATSGTGTAPYQYSFNGSSYSAANTLTLNDNGLDQPYTYSVRDAKGCIVSGGGTLLKLNPPTDLSFTAAPITCTATTTTVTANGTNGVGTLTYEIVFPIASATANTSGVFAGLSPGTYIFKVTDANGCYYTESHVVNPVMPITVLGNKTSDVLCKGDSSGSIQYTVSGFSGTYSYVFNGQTAVTGQISNSIVKNGLATGTYLITVTDETTACTANTSITITEPAAVLALTAAATNVNCNNDNSQITVNASGGTTNYTYAAVISGASAPTTYSNSNIITVDTNSATNLIWDVYVKDAKGCIATTSITLTSDALPTINTPAIQCYVGSPINISITGTSVGVPTYSIGSGYQSSPNFTINTAGTYTLSLKDASGCVATTTYTVYPQLTVLPSITKELDCTASPAATITVTAAGGKSPYSYAVSTDGGSTYATMGTNVYSTFVAGTFQFRVTDANNCITTATTTINPLTPITATTTNIDPSCNGASDGSVQIIPSGGVAPYTYSFDGSPFTATSLYSNLKAGIAYPYEVRDSKNCSFTATVTLTEPVTLAATASVTPFTCSTSNTKQAATITVTATSGTGTAPYQYSFNGSGYSAVNTLTLNDNGLDQPYTYSVRDAKGCMVSGGGTLLKLNPPTDLSFTAAPITCTATTTTVTANGTNGVGTLTYEIVFPIASATANTSGVFAGLSPGTYIFKVTDANGCYYTESHILNPVTPIAVIATKLTDVDCFGNTTGAIRYNVSGFTTYSYSVNGGTAITGQTATVFTLPNLGAATYNVVFTDETTGCTAPTSITITQPAAALSATIAQVNANCFTPTSKVTVTPAGGTASYNYAYMQDGVPPIATDYIAANVANLNPTTNANWDIWIKDANGCTVKYDIAITTDPTPTITASATGQCLGVGSYTITAAGSGGTGTLNYSINAGASYQAGNTFVVATAGSYTIRVKDANGCTADSAPVIVAPQLTLSAILNKDITCNPAPTAAQITITATGGTAPFSYESKEASGSYTSMAGNVFNSSVAGSYTFRVTDANGCSVITTTPIVISTPVNPDITTVTQTAIINCNGDATAAISIAIDNSKGQSPFVFNVKNNTLNIDYGTQTSGLRAGSYTITVTDAKGCTDTENITIAEPTKMVIEKTIVPITCDGTGVSKGSIIIDKITDGISTIGGSGGTAPYTYYVTGINAYNQSEPNPTGNTSTTFDIVDFGLYQIRVVDANGCSVIEKDVLVASPPNSLGIAINSSVTCATGGTATVKITSTFAGAGPFHFNIYNGPGQVWVADGTNGWQGETPPGSKETLFSNLSPGVTYTFIVYDEDTKCYYYETSTIPIPSNTSLSVDNLVPKNITCTGNNDGNVSFDVTNAGGTSLDYTYEIFEAFTNISKYASGTFSVSGLSTTNTPNIPINLGVGTYYVYIKETSGANAGCGRASANFNIKESPVLLSLTATKIKNVNCNEDGIIAAQAKDGTAPYTYQYLLASDPAPTASTVGWTANTTFATSVTGNYIVYAKDDYGCIKQDALTLEADDTPTITPPVAPICYDGSTAFTITFSGTVDPDIPGNATYSVNGSAFQTSPSFTFNAAGIYNLVIKDGNGCTANVNYEVYPKLNLAAALTKELDCTGTPNAEITLTTTGGNTTLAANYTYEVSTNGGGSWTAMATNVYAASIAGTYDFRVTDANNPTLCQATTTFTLDPIPPTLFTTTQTNVSCNSGNDGTITVNVTSGVGPYEYQLDSGTFQSSNVFTGLAAGTTYVITVKDAKSCLYPSTPITITEPTALSANTNLTTPLTCGAGNVAQPATVTINGVNGTVPYVYSFDGGANYSSTNTYQSYVGTTFDVLVKDSKGCVYTLTNGVNIPALVPPTDLTFNTTSTVTCLAAGTVEITGHTGGVGTLQYETIAPSPIIIPQQTTTTFAGLTPGTYLFQITDANGCTYQESYTVNPVTNITVSGQLISDVTCNPGANGQVLFTPGNFAGMYSYSLDGGTTVITGQTNPTITLSGLTTGTQTIIVTDETTGCTATTSVAVTQPAPLALVANPFINANCNFGAQVSVTASGGVAPYSYSYVISGTPAGTYSTSASAVLDPALATSWDVYVKDANGCVITTPLTITITKDPLPIIVMPASQCFVGTSLTIDLSNGETVAVGPATYTINGSNQTSPIYTINAPGTYKLNIVDANGCSSNVVDYIVQPQLSLNAALTKELDCTVSPDAVVTLTTGGGTAPYTLYEYSTNAGTSYTAMGSNVLTTSTAGNYIFKVTDTQGCQAISSEVTITPKTTPTFTLVQTNVSCNGGSDGSVVITAANGIAPYQYSIDNGATYQPSNVFTGLNAAGTYNVIVKDSKSCTSAATSITITEPTIVGGTAVLTQGLTCGAGNATQAALVTVTGSGGTGSYTYSFDGGVNYTASNTYSTNLAGMVTAYIKDANGCISAVPATVNVPALNPPTDLNFVSTTVTCLALTSDVTLTTTNGVGALSYAILSPVSATSNVTGASSGIFTGLLPGTYLFQVTDANGCTYQESYTVNPVTNITVSGQLVSDVTCNPGNNGEVLFSIGNFATTYSYSINGVPTATGQTNPTITLSGLTTGTQTIIVTDETTGCTATTSVAVTQPAPLALVANPFINANCNFGAQVSVTASGGVAPYSYSYVISGTPAGTYSTSASAVLDPALATSWDVYVKDANGCVITTPLTITITKDPLPIIVMPASQCFVGTSLTIDLSNGETVAVGPATYTINGSNQTSPIYTINAPGTYKLNIVDANGCSSNVVDYIVQPQLSLNAALTKELDCTVSPDAVVTLTAGGGTAPYTLYEYSTNAGASYTAMASNVLTTSTAGTYIFRVTDTQGCQAISSEVTITPKTTPTFTLVQTNVSCNGGSDGNLVITAANGIAPYQYSIDNGATYQPSNVFTGLNAAGTYTVVVKDSKSCTSAATSITITEPTIVGGTAVLTQGLTCGAGNATQAALVTVTGSGGTGSYTYSFDGGVNYTASNTYSTNVAGVVTAYIKDANGCISIVPATANVPALNPPTDLNFVSTTVTCLALTSDVTLTATNGVGALNYAILSPASATSNVTGASSGIFTGLLPDTYLFQVTDANGCTYQESYTINPVTNITVSGQLISDVTCNPGANGEVLFTVANFAGTYTYSINGAAASAPQSNPTVTISGLSTASTQTIVVTDETTGCTATTSVTVAQPAPLTLVANPFINANCNFGAQVSVTASGGVAPYSYSYVTSGAPAGTYSTSASAVLNPATATSWDVYVKDANGCVITTPLTITIATDPLPSGITVPGLSQCPSATGTYTFTVNAATGMAPFEYSIGTGFQTSPTFTVNTAGTYDVTVKDKNGCTTTVPDLVNILPALQLQATITTLPSCANGDGTLTLSATGGSGNYEYSLDAGIPQSSANFTAISAGSHTVTVRDVTTNCTNSIPVNLGAATPITGFAISKTDVTCNGGSNGVITATMATPALGVNDNPVYNYSLSGTATRPAQVSNIFNGLTAGNYTVTVTSARGCVATQNITIVEPAIITVPAPSVSQFGCNSGSNAMNFATITVAGVSGGSGIYNYEFIKSGTVVQFGSNNIYTEANLLGATYTVNVYDSEGCIGTAPSMISIVPFIALDKITVNVDKAITCNNLEDITVSASSIGGTPASLQYTVADSNTTTGVTGANYNVTNTTGVFTGLNIGNYLITVENPATGCSVNSVHYVNEPNTFDLTINSVTDVSCFGGTNGTANVTLIDRVITASNPNQSGAFSYTIVDTLGNPVTSGTSATAGPLTISALASGTYTITATLTNSPFCAVSKNFSISQPSAALTITETHTAITCISGNNDGSISATATGGWPGGYQFELVGPVTVAYSAQSNFTNLTAGTYTVNVKDSKGCVATTTVTLVVPTPINATATPNTTLLSCFGDKNAIITVSNTTGGQGSNYSYILNMISPTASSSGPQLSPIFNGLGAGTYTVTIMDGYNCSFTSANIVIAEPTVIKANLVVASTQTCQNQTQLTLTASGGTAPYFYSADNVTYSATSFASSVTFPVAVGTHSYYVKDSNGCMATVSNSITIDPLPALTINLDLTNAVINCKGDASGVIVADAQGGLGNYIYSLLDGSGNAISPTPTQLSPGNFTALVAGNYMVKVDSGDCSKTSAVITIKEPLLQLAETHTIKNVSCNGAKNGEIVINASNGTGIIQYAISPNLNQFDDINTFKDLKPGNYDVIVQDQTGCYIKINFDITEPDLLTVGTIPNSIVPEICAGDKDGAFSITIGGGSVPYSVSLDNPNGTYTTGSLSQTDFDFTGLTGGNHIVYIRDAAGCNTNWSVLLPESVYMNPMATVNYDCVNNAAANSVTVTVDASITNPADVDYSLDGGTYQTNNIFTNLVPGTHYITTRHTNGCEQKTSDFNIVQVDPLTLVLNDGGLNEIVATAAGGGGNYQYTLNGESYGNTSNFIIYKSGDYTVTVTDANGCVASATRHFEYIDVCVPNHFTPNGDGIEDGWAPGCTINYTNLTFDIFDRYGRKVATYRLGQYWDGKYNGKELPTGDYWYVLKLNDVKDAREFVGHFTLYR